MGELRKITVELADEVAVDIDRAVEVGDYGSIDEVVQTALQVWQRSREAEVARLRAAIEEGLASGEPIDMPDDFFEQIVIEGDNRLAAERAAR